MAAARYFKPKNFTLFRIFFLLKKNLTTFSKLSCFLFVLYVFTMSVYNYIEFSPGDYYSNNNIYNNNINTNTNSAHTRADDYTSAADYITSESKADDVREEIAFFLQIQHSTLHLLPRLFNRIYHPENIYIVHFDTDVHLPQGIAWLLRGNVSQIPGHLPTNVKIMPSETVNYMGISMTLNTINAMQVALDFSPGWRYFINLSGNDYPLVSPETIRGALSHRGRSREFFCFKPLKRRFWHRFSFFALDSALDPKNMERPVYEYYVPNPVGFFSRSSIFKAEAWMIISRQFAKFITHSSYARRVLLLFSYSSMSDELYFPTVARNTLFNTLTVNSCMRQIRWYNGQKWARQHPFFLDDLYDQNVRHGAESRIHLANYSAFFARKFRNPNSKFMNIIDHNRDLDNTTQRINNYFRDQLDLSNNYHRYRSRAHRNSKHPASNQ